MAPLTAEHHDAWLEHHADAWSTAGLISPTQAAAIREYEHRGAQPPGQRLTLVTEFATYLGAVIALAGGAAIIGPNWVGLRLVGQLVLSLAIATIGFVAGTWLVRFGEPAAGRVGSFLRAVGTGGVALAVGSVVHYADPAEQAWYPASIGAAVLAVGVALWRNLERPIELVTATAGLVALMTGLATWIDLTPWVVAPVLWCASAGFGALAATGHVRPRLVALMIASVGLFAAGLVLAGANERAGTLVTVTSAVGIVAFATHDRSIPLLVVAMLLFFNATTMLMQVVLHGMLARAVAVVFGLVVVTYVAVNAQRHSRTPSEPE